MHEQIAKLLYDPTTSALRHLFDAAPVGVSLAVDGKIVYANDECARMFGFESGHAMIDSPFFDMIASEMHPFVAKLWNARAEDDTTPWRYELIGTKRDGERFPYQCISLHVPVPEGRGTFAYLLDLSAQRHAEEELRLHRGHLDMLMEICVDHSEEDGAA